MKVKKNEFYKGKIKSNNGFILKTKIKEYFHLTTRQVTLLSMLLAFELVTVVISKYTTGLLLIGGAYTIEFSFFAIILISLLFNSFYTCIITIISIWARIWLPPSEPVGLISLTIADLTFLLVFCPLFYNFKKVFSLSLNNNKIKKYGFWVFVAGATAGFISSLVSLVCNYLFIFDLYYVPPTAWLLILGFITTNVKYLLNIFICCYLFKVLSKVFKSFEIAT